ncbi:MAG: hypothetical protein AMXMBFR57_37500 [Acidimicrobiia bacterium]
MDWTVRILEVLTGRGRAGQPGSPTDLALQDMADEWAQHAAAAWQTARAEGMSQEEATRHVDTMIQQWADGIDGPPRRTIRRLAVEPPSTAGGGASGWWMDVRYGWRILLRQPGLTLTAVLTAALAVGATTTLFSVADAVLRRPLPYPASTQMVRISETREGATRQLPAIMSHVTYQTWRDTSAGAPETIDAVAAFRAASMVIGESGSLERVRGAYVTASMFTVLGVSPYRGTFFSEADVAERRRVVVVGYDFWKTHLAGADSAIGQTLRMDGDAYEVVAVLPPGITFPESESRFMAPLQVPPIVVSSDGSSSIALFGGVARLKPGVSAAQASAEATARAKTGPPPAMIDTAVFGSRGDRLVTATPAIAFATGEVRPAILVFLVAVGLLFLTAVANVSSLQLARATGRRRELASRAAIGAGAGRLARQLLVESLLLSLLGGVVGVGLAALLHRLLPMVLPADFPRVHEIVMNWRVVVFAVVASVVAGVLSGLLPVWQARRLRLVDVLTEDGQAPVGLSRRTSVGRLRLVILVAQVAAATVLLVGAALLGRSFAALWQTDRGYQPLNALTARVPLPDPPFSPARRADVLDQMLSRLRGVPGVQHAGFTSALPLTNVEGLMGFTMPPRPRQDAPVNAQAGVKTISPGFLEALGAVMVEGRDFTMQDTAASPAVVLVNETFARTYLDGRALGARLPVSADNVRTESEVVGVVRDIHPRSRGEEPGPELFFAAGQVPQGVRMPEPVLVVRTTSAPDALVPMLRQFARDADAAILLDNVMTMEDRLSAGLARPRLYAVLLTGLSALALLIAAVGVFGVLSHNVVQRRREIGLRAALGARPADIVRTIVAQGVWVTGVGLVVGLAAAAFAVRFLRELLWGVEALDGVSFAAVPAVLVAVAVVACWWPARRATRIDPLTALRQ